MARAALTSVILLAGGRGRRLGGVNKALLRKGPAEASSTEPDAGPAASTTLLSQWCDVLYRRGIGGVIVGDPDLGQHLSPAASTLLKLTREDPPFSGPAAAVCAGVRALPAETPQPDESADHRTGSQPDFQVPKQVLLCAVDIAEPAALVDWLLDRAAAALGELGAHGMLPHDGAGRAQWLASVISADWLLRRVAMIPPGEEHGKSLRWLLGPATLTPAAMPPHLGQDIDDPGQARRFGFRV